MNNATQPPIADDNNSLGLRKRPFDRYTLATQKCLPLTYTNWNGATRRRNIPSMHTPQHTYLIARQHFQYYGHLQCMEANIIPKIVFNYKPCDGHRSRDRPRTNWPDNIQQITEERGVTWHEVQQEEVDTEKEMVRIIQSKAFQPLNQRTGCMGMMMINTFFFVFRETCVSSD